MSGDPDVLEYYKNDHSKKPLRIINLNFCEQVDAGLTFNKKELQDSFVFDIKTSERTFYLVAETEEDMNKWVQSICQICGFSQAEESADSLRNISSASHGARSSPAELSSSNQHLLRERKSSAPSHSSQPTLFTFEPPMSNHMQPTLSTSAPQEYLYLHQCLSRRVENTRSASFSQGTRASFLMRSDTAVQKLAQGNGHCVNGVSGQVHGFYSLPKPSRHNTEFRDSAYDLPRSLAAHGHTKGSLTGSETDNEDVYAFKTPSNALCREFGDLLVDNMEVPATPNSAYQIPRTFTLDKNHNAMAVGAPGDSAIAPPPRPPKPSQAETPRWGSSQQRPPISENSRSVSAATIPRRNTLPAMDNSRLHRASSCESYDHPQRGGESAGRSSESMSDGVSSFLPGENTHRADQTAPISEDNYVPMNPGSSTLLVLGARGVRDSPCVSHVSVTSLFTADNTTFLPAPVKPTPLDLRSNTVIDELPFKSPVTKSWSRAIHSFNSSSSQYCRPTSTQSITSTDSGDSEENYVSMQYPVSASPIPSGTNSPAPKKSTGSVDYLALDFQPSSPSPHRKPSTSSVTSDEKVDYVQVDKEKTQALQSTMQEWTDVRQSSEPSKGAKL
ncbi:LOW QUALITY PROTEIN: GRB2-associated-binding protein 2 [Myotis lucifugus]|uniref:LOW QUALITY PROTEIN: GRB2-associated-binding protein 2 n=1 Tax=Myotis lucifugus TaxID=59463 RepID=UPI000CCC3C3C|nr:LOW QUALITY PROTEIN: GRB2-associated-binding protein 2 [Myotis lucifugus]